MATDPHDNEGILQRLERTIAARRQAGGGASWVATLNAKGLDAVLKKVGEEATETVIAAKSGDRAQLVHEMADLWFHCLVLLEREGVPLDAVLAELQQREGTSGVEEKAARGGPKP